MGIRHRDRKPANFNFSLKHYVANSEREVDAHILSPLKRYWAIWRQAVNGRDLSVVLKQATRIFPGEGKWPAPVDLMVWKIQSDLQARTTSIDRQEGDVCLLCFE